MYVLARNGITGTEGVHSGAGLLVSTELMGEVSQCMKVYVDLEKNTLVYFFDKEHQIQIQIYFGRDYA